jgi:hypothetical protein
MIDCLNRQNKGARVTRPKKRNPDAAVLNQIRELTKDVSNKGTQTILRSVIDAVALNPQPLPPRAHYVLKAVIDALNPQPLPPGPPPPEKKLGARTK